MKSKWWLVPVAFALIGVLWILASDQTRLEPLRAAIGLKPPSVERAKSKPICSQVIVPTGDCIPQHLANLPPDPGEAGKQTIEGIDADKDGVRDDVQRYIWEEYPESARAREALFLMARVQQMQVIYGDSLGKEETRKRMTNIAQAAICSNRIEAQGMDVNAAQKVRDKVTNTPERWQRSREFAYLLAHNLYEYTDFPVAEACGFDPAALPN